MPKALVVERQLKEVQGMTRNAQRYAANGAWREARYAIRLANQALKQAHEATK